MVCWTLHFLPKIGVRVKARKFVMYGYLCRGVGKSLARPLRKEAKVSVRMA